MFFKKALFDEVGKETFEQNINWIEAVI